MLVKTKAIVLNAVRYQEKSLVARCYTRDYGIKTYFIQSAFGKGRKAPYFQPLTILDLLASHRNKGKLEAIKEIALAYPYKSITTNIVKSSLAIFIADVLYHAIKEEQANQVLFDFLEDTCQRLDSADDIANFHLVLLLELTHFLGIYPDCTASELPFFNLREGCFSLTETWGCTTREVSALFLKLVHYSPTDSLRIFTHTERQELVKLLLDYYQIHLEGFVLPKSVEVLQAVFSAS